MAFNLDILAREIRPASIPKENDLATGCGVKFSIPCELAIFAGVPCAQIRGLLEGAKVVSHKGGEHLFREGESSDFFGYILSGAYKLSLVDEAGDEVIMHFGVRGEALGIMATMEGDSKFPFDAVAMGESQFLMIPRRNFVSRWIHNPPVMMRFQSNLQGRIFRSHDEKRLQRRPLSERIADLLVYLSEHKGSRAGRIEIPITRREIAGYVGASVESVIRTMSSWSRDGILETSDRHIRIHDRQRLLEIRVDAPLDASSAGQGGLSALWQKTGISSHHEETRNFEREPAEAAQHRDCVAARRRALSFAH